LLQDHKEATRRLRDLAGKQDNEPLVQQLNERNAEIEEKIRQTKSQLTELKISLMQQLTSFLRVKLVLGPSLLFLLISSSAENAEVGPFYP